MGSCVIFALCPCAAVLPGIYDADHPLGAGMNMHMSDFDGLLVTALVLVQCLDEVELQAQQPIGIAAIHLDCISELKDSPSQRSDLSN